jgi:hypothetical protein
VQPARADPPAGRGALPGRAAPLGRLPLGVRSGEGPLAMLADRRLMLAGLDRGGLSQGDDRMAVALLAVGVDRFVVVVRWNTAYQRGSMPRPARSRDRLAVAPGGVGLAVGLCCSSSLDGKRPRDAFTPRGRTRGHAGSPTHGADGRFGGRGGEDHPATNLRRTQGPLSALRASTQAPRPQSGRASGRGACRRGPHGHAQHQQERPRAVKGYTHR